MKVYLFIFVIISLISFGILKLVYNSPTKIFVSTSNSLITNTPIPTLSPIPTAYLLKNDYHTFQTFNNCGPAALSMALSYYGINKTQQELGQKLRPYQDSNGNNDDKSVTLDELAQEASKYKLIPFHRPNGTLEIVTQFISHGIPVITRTLLKENDDIGHYRVIKGYDNTTSELIQDDSLQGHNLRYIYSDFRKLWQPFNYEYLVLVPEEKIQITENILGEDFDRQTSWHYAVENSREVLRSHPEDVYARFNLSIALYRIGNFSQSISEFEKVESRLPFRTLWYQTEPIQAYYELGNYQRVFDLTEKILANQNRAFSELYAIRGEIFKKQGKPEDAKKELDKAIFYNKNIDLDKIFGQYF